MKKILLGITDTAAFAKEFSKKLKPKKSGAMVVGLIGDLGAGKTTFVKTFAKALGIKSRIISPTFIIIKRFALPKDKTGFKNLYHLDCYRISSKDLIKLGFKTAIKDKENLMVIEWADRIGSIMPKDSIWLKFSHPKYGRGRVLEINQKLNIKDQNYKSKS